MFNQLKLQLPIIVVLTIVSFRQLLAQQSTNYTVSEFMGVNANVASYDNNYIPVIADCFKWMREYHSWAHYEAANNYYKWDNITKNPHTYTWPNHNKFMDKCKENGINVLIDALNKPDWMGSSHIPNNTGDGSFASDYIEKLEFLGQLVARYGSREIGQSKLETADKATGLGIIKYYEDENEPNYWWWTPKWAVASYAAFCNAAHDGYGVQPDSEHPLLGIKSVDPDAKHVIAGSAGTDSLFFHQVLQYSNGRVPFDVLNVHMYCTDQHNGYSPEHETYGYENQMAGLFKWKNRVLPNTPIWITEFGWDTYLAKSGSHSYTYAIFDAQANYLLRSFLIFMKMGYEKAFMFMDSDVNSENTTQYSSSGFMKDKKSGFEKKPSYFYLATMQKILGETRFVRPVAYALEKDNKHIYCLEFENSAKQEKVFALWTRENGSKNDNGAKANYELDLGKIPVNVYAVLPVDQDIDGDTVSINPEGTKVNLQLTETPLFLVVSDHLTSSKIFGTSKVQFTVYPNPSGGTFHISVKMPESGVVNFSLFSSDGKLIQSFSESVEQGNNEFVRQNFEHLRSGFYFLKCSHKWGTTANRVIIQNNK